MGASTIMLIRRSAMFDWRVREALVVSLVVVAARDATEQREANRQALAALENDYWTAYRSGADRQKVLALRDRFARQKAEYLATEPLAMPFHPRERTTAAPATTTTREPDKVEAYLEEVARLDPKDRTRSGCRPCASTRAGRDGFPRRRSRRRQ
jgi:hypothetical protein